MCLVMRIATFWAHCGINSLIKSYCCFVVGIRVYYGWILIHAFKSLWCAAGKISRRVSLVHYPEPEEFEKQSTSNLRQMYQRSGGSSLTHSSHHYATPSRSTKLKSGRTVSTHSSRHKRRHADNPAVSTDQLT